MESEKVGGEGKDGGRFTGRFVKGDPRLKEIWERRRAKSVGGVVEEAVESVGPGQVHRDVVGMLEKLRVDRARREFDVSGPVPVGFADNVDFRLAVMSAAGGDAGYRKEVIARCGEDVEFCVNVFGWQHNPTKVAGLRRGPFVLWDFQAAALKKMQESIRAGRDMVVEKSREMGATWLCCYLGEWVWHFAADDASVLMMSRSADAVDKPGDPKSLFWKIDFIHRHLPEWLMPAGWEKGEHRRKMLFENPSNGATITGEPSTARTGVGGRATFMFLDEFSQVREAEEVLQRTSDTTPCRIFNGTHLGVNTAFYRLTRNDRVRKVRMHWTQHPEKVAGLYRFDRERQCVEVLDKTYEFPADYPFVLDGTPTGGACPGVRSVWYDEQCVRKGSSRGVAMDLDIDAQGSTSQFFDPIMIRSLQAAYCRPPLWRGELRFDSSGVPEEFVPDAAGKLLLWRPLTPDGWPQKARYAAGFDVSAGTGATPSCCGIVDCDTGEKVAEYADATIDPKVFGRLGAALCRSFKAADGTGAFATWEMQGPGVDFRDGMSKAGYRRTYRRVDEFNGKISDKEGWFPSNDSKLKVLSDYRDALKTRQCVNPSIDALEETLDFEYTPSGVEHGGIEGVEGDPSGARVNHGDRVIADALMWLGKLRVAGVKTHRKELQKPEQLDARSVAGRREMVEQRGREQEEG